MRVCPYCLQYFSTKQRLVSHLTKNKKCYDVEKIGVPPILLELMGFNVTQTISVQSEQPSNNIEKIIEPNTDQSIDQKRSQEEVSAKIKRTTEFQCQYCNRYFINQKNLDRHTSTNKCPKMKKGLSTTNENTSSVTSTHVTTQIDNTVLTPSKSDDQLDDSDHNEMVNGGNLISSDAEDSMYKPKNAKRPDLLPKRNLKNKKSALNEEKLDTRKLNIKYIIKEDYINCLESMYGSREEALKCVKSCIQAKLRGDISLLYKIYFENRENKNYPIEVLDAKGKKLYYKLPDNIILDENGSTVKSILAENLQNCYLKFCNHIIDSNIDDNDVLFNDYDLNDIQKHVLELSEDKIKDKLLIGLIELIKK